MSRTTHLAFNRKFKDAGNRDGVIRRTDDNGKPITIPADVRKVGSCWRCGNDIFAGTGQLVRTTVHRRCEKLHIRPPVKQKPIES